MILTLLSSGIFEIFGVLFSLESKLKLGVFDLISMLKASGSKVLRPSLCCTDAPDLREKINCSCCFFNSMEMDSGAPFNDFNKFSSVRDAPSVDANL